MATATTATTPAAEPEGRLLVGEKRLAAVGVVAIDLLSPDGTELPAWRPGAHIDLVLANDLVRQYSLCGSPADRGSWRVSVLREPDSRGGSASIHDQLQPGDTVGFRGPRNHFELESAPRYLFIAGGIGITPILPMVASADAAGAEWKLLYGGRTRSSMAFTSEVARYGDAVLLRPEDEFGLLDLASFIGEPAAGTAIYCCGPEPLLRAVETLCENLGISGDVLHTERFSARPDAPGAGGGEFQVELRRSGLTLSVPGNQSILEAVRDAGADVLSSCEDGICGTCITTVLDGEVIHRDSVLSRAERASGKSMALCVSRSAGPRLVLDL
jgi:ferredoxin-NADP reductase